MGKGTNVTWQDENGKGVEASMSTHPGSLDDNTYIFDTESAAEMARLITVNQFTTRCLTAWGSKLE